jgi:hypothetical protein
MVTQINPHFFTNWAKERLDEMDAAVTSLEGKVAEVQADVRDKAKKILADLRKQRDDFRDTMKEQSEANVRGRGQEICRELRQANRAPAGDIQASSRRPIESVARSGRQAWQRCQKIRF